MSYSSLENKKVLITGGAGFIGSHVVDKLLENRAQVVVLDNLSSGKLSNIPDNKIKFYQANIENPQIDEIFNAEKPDFVIHLAAQTSVASSVVNPEFDAKMNILGSINVLKTSKKYSVKKIIAASSAAVYGNPQYLPIDENHPTIPMSPYGVSKLAMERYIKLLGIPYIIFRFSNAYGPRQQSSKESGVIAIFNDAMLNNKPINIYGDGEQLRDFIYVEDIARVCCKALNSDIKNEIFNFSTNKGVTINQVFDEMKHVYGYELQASYLSERDGEIKDSILSNRKFMNFGFDSFFSNLEDKLINLKQYGEKHQLCKNL